LFCVDKPKIVISHYCGKTKELVLSGEKSKSVKAEPEEIITGKETKKVDGILCTSHIYPLHQRN
jgi:hypothetical protein